MFILITSILCISLTKDTVVSGTYRLMAFATPASKRKSKTVIIGKILDAVGAHEHKVRFVNGKEIICKSCKLKVVRPEDIPPSLRSTTTTTEEADNSNDQSRSLEPNSDNEEINPSMGLEPDIPDAEGEEELNRVEDVVENNEREDAPNDQEPAITSLNYFDRLMRARAKVTALTGDTVETKKQNQVMLWTVIENHVAGNNERHKQSIGIKPEVLAEIRKDPAMAASEIFLRLMYGDNIVDTITKVNRAIQTYNKCEPNRRPMKLFSHS